VRIPVYGNVAAGIPIEAITDIEDYEEISQDMAAKGEYAALRIHGDSMEPRMTDGDVVIVRLQETIESGETAIVMVNGSDATCKKIMRTDEGIMLLSTNAKYSPMFYSNKQIEEIPVRIWGKVVELRAKF
jgi:repressor LexA